MTKKGTRKVKKDMNRASYAEEARLKAWAKKFKEQKAPYPDWYTLGELSDYLNIQKDTCRKWIREGKLPEAAGVTGTGWPVWSPQQVKDILRTISYGPTEKKHGLER